MHSDAIAISYALDQVRVVLRRSAPYQETNSPHLAAAALRWSDHANESVGWNLEAWEKWPRATQFFENSNEGERIVWDTAHQKEHQRRCQPSSPRSRHCSLHGVRPLVRSVYERARHLFDSAGQYQ